MSKVTIRVATPDDLDAVRGLLWDYRQVLIDRTQEMPGLVDVYYEKERYAALLDALPGAHVPPDGILLVAEHQGRVVACGMTQRIAPGVCELKRVFVAPEARGLGAAVDLCNAATDWMAGAGYSRAVLDTMTVLTEAIALYRRLGFRECAPYHAMPTEHEAHVLYFEQRLV